jgi:hypothetical protein
MAEQKRLSYLTAKTVMANTYLMPLYDPASNNDYNITYANLLAGIQTSIEATEVPRNNYVAACLSDTTDDYQPADLVPAVDIDGYTLVAGDIVFLYNTNHRDEIGLYEIQTGTDPAVRVSYYDDDIEIVYSTIIIQNGTTYKGTKWRCITDLPIVVGTTDLYFEQIKDVNYNGIFYIGDDATANYTLAKIVVANGVTGHTYASPLGISGEAIAILNTGTATGVGGNAKTNGSANSRGVVGVGGVTAASDSGQAIGVCGRSITAHTGGDNIAFKANAQNASGSGENYSFYGDYGKMLQKDEAWFGDKAGGDYLTIEDTGVLKFNGAAQVWDDANVGALVLRTGGTLPGTVQILDNTGTGTGIYTLGFAVNEEGSGCIEFPHSYAEGTDISFHCHIHIQDAPTGTDKIKFQLIYSVIRNGSTVPAVPASPVVSEIDVDTQYEAHMVVFPDITGTNFDIGDQFCFTIKRIAASADEFGGEALMHTVGFHYQKDTVGSRSVSSK